MQDEFKTTRFLESCHFGVLHELFHICLTEGENISKSRWEKKMLGSSKRERDNKEKGKQQREREATKRKGRYVPHTAFSGRRMLTSRAKGIYILHWREIVTCTAVSANINWSDCWIIPMRCWRSDANASAATGTTPDKIWLSRA